jgi:4-diphosphocytidyl-2-C-methyl-D-erythritol kinase
LAKGFELKKEELPADEIHVRAPAKINLILRVLDRLPNGYHRIWSVMNTVDLADRLAIRQIRTSSGIRLSCHDASVPQGNDNLVHRAAESVLKQAGLEVGLQIDLDKKIPMAAGLGGGSSDAAATIVGLVGLLNLGWSLVDMAKLGSQLGSDVAFFFSAPSALVCEWGQVVVPLSITGVRWIVLVNPGFPIETKWAYERLSATRGTVSPIGPQLEAIQQYQSVTWDELVGLMENDFESALFPVFPKLEKLKTDLLAVGAQAALLSGSGATMIGIFPDEKTAIQAKIALPCDSGSRVIVAKSEPTSSWTSTPGPLFLS